MTEPKTQINAEFTDAEKTLLLNSLRMIRRKDVLSFIDEGTQDRISEIFGRLQQALETETPKHW